MVLGQRAIEHPHRLFMLLQIAEQLVHRALHDRCWLAPRVTEVFPLFSMEHLTSRRRRGGTATTLLMNRS
jgi:hypothetical protein